MHANTSPALDSRPAETLSHPLDSFERRIRQEWTEASGIAPDLFDCSVSFASDLEVTLGGDVSTPIHDALGWQYRCFGHQPRSSLQAALLFAINPEADWALQVFQAKLSEPVFDRAKGKPRKYESPKGFGVRGGFSPVPDRLWFEVGKSNGVAVCCPLDGKPEAGKSYEFWQWVADCPDVALTVTEGFKKAQHLLSQGRACIALSGITMGVYDPDGTGKRLRPYLQRFANPERQVFIAFDAETKPKTIRDVARETRKLGRCFTEAGCQVRVLRIPLLPGTTKTGIDDYGVATGPAAISQLYAKARDYTAWLWLRRYYAQRSRQPSLKLHTPELNLDLDRLPATGIVALQSCKGSGKTNSIRKLVGDRPKVLLLTHRICLGRSLAERLDIAWKSDTDRANGSWIVGGADLTRRLGLCVDSLLSIDPNEFRGCELVLDEFDQVLAHLLTSSTCNKDGRRPALLARLHDLVKVAARVIIASADLTDADLEYCEQLRDGESAYLIRNTFVPNGFEAQILDAPDKSAVVAQLLEAIAQQKKVFVATDAKSDSKAIAQLVSQIEDSVPDSRILVVNSDTSGSEEAIDFIRNVNERVIDYDIVIATPSMATGVSIEVNHFELVFGLFTGVLKDDYISQALSRVRAPIPRIIWCAKTGKNYSRIGRSDYAEELKTDLLTLHDKQICLIRTSLRPDLGAVVQEDYGFHNNPHLDLWAKIAANTNAAMWRLRDDLMQRLRLEGNRVELIAIAPDENKAVKESISAARKQVKETELRALEAARVLSELELKQLQSKESRTPEQLRNERKTQIAKFYCLEDDQITPELLELDDGGRLRGRIIELEALLDGPELAIRRDTGAISRQAYWGKGLFLPDLSRLELRRQVRKLLKLDEFLTTDREWTSEDLDPLCEMALRHAREIECCLGYRLNEKMSNGQIVRALLAQLGIRCQTRFVGPRGAQVKYYRLDEKYWQKLQGILDRRKQVREEAELEMVSTPLVKDTVTDRVDTRPIRVGDWVRLSNQETMAWLVSKVEKGMCWLQGVTGQLQRSVPLEKARPA